MHRTCETETVVWKLSFEIAFYIAIDNEYTWSLSCPIPKTQSSHYPSTDLILALRLVSSRQPSTTLSSVLQKEWRKLLSHSRLVTITLPCFLQTQGSGVSSWAQSSLQGWWKHLFGSFSFLIFFHEELDVNLIFSVLFSISKTNGWLIILCNQSTKFQPQFQQFFTTFSWTLMSSQDAGTFWKKQTQYVRKIPLFLFRS